MAFLRVFLIISGLAGIHSITTVSKVSVKKGKSVSIPCLYDKIYKENVKYLCKGYTWNSCSYEIKTNQENSKKFSISENRKQSIINVTINDLTEEDTHYWCAVEIDNWKDVKQYFQLSVTRDTPSLYVHNQDITGSKGNNVTIQCHAHNAGEIKWCRIGHSECVTTSGTIDGMGVTINKDKTVFTVTMSGLRMESTGWYWCGKGDLQMPVHITVTSTATVTTTSSLTTSPTSEPVNLTTVFADTTDQNQQHSVYDNLKKFIIPLSVLVFIVILNVFIWFMLKRCNQTKATSLAMNGRVQPETDQDVTYSSVVPTRQQGVGRQVEANEDVTYSMLA